MTDGYHHATAKRLLLHVAVPLLATLALVGLYFTPVTAIGCVNRGFAALAVALASGLAALVAGFKASRAGARADASAGWWLATAVLLLAPVLLLIWPLG